MILMQAIIIIKMLRLRKTAMPSFWPDRSLTCQRTRTGILTTTNNQPEYPIVLQGHGSELRTSVARSNAVAVTAIAASLVSPEP